MDQTERLLKIAAAMMIVLVGLAGAALFRTARGRPAVAAPPAAQAALSTRPTPAPPPARPMATVVTPAAGPVATKPPAAKPSVPALPASFGATINMPTAAEKPKRHRIADGDTLASLACRYLGSAERAGELFEANRDVLAHPELLPIGVVLRIPAGATVWQERTMFPSPLSPVVSAGRP